MPLCSDKRVACELLLALGLLVSCTGSYATPNGRRWHGWPDAWSMRVLGWPGLLRSVTARGGRAALVHVALEATASRILTWRLGADGDVQTRSAFSITILLPELIVAFPAANVKQPTRTG